MELKCSFCQKNKTYALKRLIVGPGGVYICNECVERSQQIISKEILEKKQIDTENIELNCSFCQKDGAEVNNLIAGPNRVYICNECVERSQQILDKEAIAK